MKLNIKIQTGFTLIEMLVAMLIFSLITGTAIGVLISALDAQRRLLATQELLSQTSYVMEYMGRAIRMARKDIDGSCITDRLNYEKTHAGQGIEFKNSRGVCQEFYLDGTRLVEIRGGERSYLTSERLEVFAFNIGPDHNWDQDDNYQPRVTLFLEIIAKEGRLEDRPRIQIQTTISQRSPDIRQ